MLSINRVVPSHAAANNRNGSSTNFGTAKVSAFLAET
jgi:hypothetical protein